MGRLGIMGTGHTATEILSRAMNVTRGFALRSRSKNKAEASVLAASELTKDIDEAIRSTFEGIRRPPQK